MQEWLWVAMFFYRAKLAVAKAISEDGKDPALYEKTRRFVRSRMGAYWKHIQDSVWASLPELTDANGETCHYSCGAQAWTIGCLLETVDELYQLLKSWNAASLRILSGLEYASLQFHTQRRQLLTVERKEPRGVRSIKCYLWGSLH